VQQTLSGHRGKINSLDFSQDGQTLVSGSDDQTIRLWNVVTGQLVKTVQAHEGPVTSVSVGSRYLASGGDDDTVKLWQLDGTLVNTLAEHGLAISQVQFNPQGDLLASASWDNTIKLWRDGTLVQTLTGHQDGVTSLAFHPDQPILVSGSADQSIKVWETAQGKLIKTLDGLDNPVEAIQMSQEGLWINTETKVGWMNLRLKSLLDSSCRQMEPYLTTNTTLPRPQKQLCPDSQ